jgi:hypothetical protein
VNQGENFSRNKWSISRPAGLHYAKVHQLERQQTADVQGAPTASSQIKVNQALPKFFKF